jgi:hypothetical protein
MLLDLVLALGLLLSTASQLRPADARVGPGEACLAIWLVLMLAREATRLGPPLTPVLSRLLIFWTVFTIALCLGTMTEFALGYIHDPVWFVHDIIAYVLVAAVSCLSVVEPGAELRLRRVSWLLATLGAAWLILQAAYGWGLVSVGNFDPWEWDRLRGLSENSNQLALVCAVIGLLSLHLAEVAGRPGERIVALLCMTVAIIVGRLTQSNAFLLALLTVVPTFVALKVRTWLLAADRTLTFRSAAAWIVILAVPLCLACVVPLGASVGSRAEKVVKEMTRGGTTHEADEAASLRFHIWNEAIRRGIESGMLGLGPGPHIDVPPSIVAGRRTTTNPPSQVIHPQVSLAPNYEAHNTVLDLFVQGGLIGVSILVWLVATALIMTYQARLDALTTLLCGVSAYSFFHFIVRHPIVWIAIALCLVTAANSRRASAVAV